MNEHDKPETPDTRPRTHVGAQNARIGNRAYPGTDTIQIHRMPDGRFKMVEIGGPSRYMTKREAWMWRLFNRVPAMGDPE